MEVRVSRAQRWSGASALGSAGGRCSRGGASEAQLVDCGVRLIFEGWLPHDPGFVAVRVL